MIFFVGCFFFPPRSPLIFGKQTLVETSPGLAAGSGVSCRGECADVPFEQCSFHPGWLFYIEDEMSLASYITGLFFNP